MKSTITLNLRGWSFTIDAQGYLSAADGSGASRPLGYDVVELGELLAFAKGWVLSRTYD